MKKEDLQALGLTEEAINAVLALNEQDLNAAQADADARISAMKFETKLDAAITKAKGRNSTAIKSLLNLDDLRTSDDQDAAISAALDALKASDGYMFESEKIIPPPMAAGAGSAPMLTRTSNDESFLSGLRGETMKPRRMEIAE